MKLKVLQYKTIKKENNYKRSFRHEILFFSYRSIKRILLVFKNECKEECATFVNISAITLS